MIPATIKSIQPNDSPIITLRTLSQPMFNYRRVVLLLWPKTNRSSNAGKRVHPHVSLIDERHGLVHRLRTNGSTTEVRHVRPYTRTTRHIFVVPDPVPGRRCADAIRPAASHRTAVAPGHTRYDAIIHHCVTTNPSGVPIHHIIVIIPLRVVTKRPNEAVRIERVHHIKI